MLENLLYSIPLSQVLTWIGVAAAIIVMVWRGWPAFRRLVAFLSASVKLVDTLATLPDDLAAIRHELERNGGGSIKDSVVRTEQAVAELATEVAHVRRQSAALKTSIAKTNRRLSDHIGPPSGDDSTDHEPRTVRGSTHLRESA